MVVALSVIEFESKIENSLQSAALLSKNHISLMSWTQFSPEGYLPPDVHTFTFLTNIGGFLHSKY